MWGYPAARTRPAGRMYVVAQPRAHSLASLHAAGRTLPVAFTRAHSPAGPFAYNARGPAHSHTMREVRPIRCMHSPATSPLGQIRMARTHARSGQSHARSGRSHVRGRSVTCGCAQPRARRPAGCMFVICPAARTRLLSRMCVFGWPAARTRLLSRMFVVWSTGRMCVVWPAALVVRPGACTWSDRAHARGPTGRMLVVRPVACSWSDRSHVCGCPAARTWAGRSHVCSLPSRARVGRPVACNCVCDRMRAVC